MRITVSMPSTGLFYSPGLARPVAIEVDELPSEVAGEIKRLVGEARLFDPGEIKSVPLAPNVRDGQQLTITVEEGDKQRTLHVSDPAGSIEDPSLRRFVEMVRQQADAARRRLRDQAR